ncbi:E-selectin-like [Neocloeon triangulifer]|uniref:E-selectin-like n=1 Tax=Neocloeon triangulifer TaxID=2078957 RepID=UPI00286EDE1E|nr:E-selectin-like [Neocloeon triangulifer]
MQLLSIENAQETLCLSSMIARPNYGGFGPSFWTAGSDQYHENWFIWCTATTTKNISSDFKWGSGEPNNVNSENCVEMGVTSGTPPNNVYYNDVNCLTYSTKYICETYEPGCSMPSCPNFTCQTDAAKQVLMEHSDKRVANNIS